MTKEEAIQLLLKIPQKEMKVIEYQIRNPHNCANSTMQHCTKCNIQLCKSCYATHIRMVHPAALPLLERIATSSLVQNYAPTTEEKKERPKNPNVTVTSKGRVKCSLGGKNCDTFRSEGRHQVHMLKHHSNVATQHKERRNASIDEMFNALSALEMEMLLEKLRNSIRAE